MAKKHSTTTSSEEATTQTQPTTTPSGGSVQVFDKDRSLVDAFIKDEIQGHARSPHLYCNHTYLFWGDITLGLRAADNSTIKDGKFTAPRKTYLSNNIGDLRDLARLLFEGRHTDLYNAIETLIQSSANSRPRMVGNISGWDFYQAFYNPMNQSLHKRRNPIEGVPDKQHRMNLLKTSYPSNEMNIQHASITVKTLQTQTKKRGQWISNTEKAICIEAAGSTAPIFESGYVSIIGNAFTPANLKEIADIATDFQTHFSRYETNPNNLIPSKQTLRKLA